MSRRPITTKAAVEKALVKAGHRGVTAPELFNRWKGRHDHKTIGAALSKAVSEGLAEKADRRRDGYRVYVTSARYAVDALIREYAADDFEPVAVTAPPQVITINPDKDWQDGFAAGLLNSPQFAAGYEAGKARRTA